MKVKGLLIRANTGTPALDAVKGFALSGYEIEPLFENVRKREALGATSSANWFLARPKDNLAGANPWELAHDSSLSGAFGVTSQDLFIEPDLEQEFKTGMRKEIGPGATGGQPKFDDQDPHFPVGPGFAWHLQNQFSQLKSARDLAVEDNKVTIAHFDTGYDPKQETVPLNLNLDFAQDFVEGGRDATDRGDSGILKNPGHGTGTLGILAGNKVPELKGDFLGGAPHARIIPIRIATSVVLFRTSAFAKALDYAHAPKNDKGEVLPPVDVVSMSMGGVASQAWADAVNSAYEAGICLVTAAGNNFSGGAIHIPTRFIVYPARFRRVIAVCGVMANFEAYDGLSEGLMQGNYGPASKMNTAISAYTPNMPWAEIGAPGIVDMNGQGTSSATPQVAAAAALWLHLHAGELQGFTGWQKVEAVRQALFSTALNSNPEKLGRGVLRSLAAIQVPAPAVETLAYTNPDSALLSIFRVLTGLGITETNDTTDRMLRLEAAQLLHQWPSDFPPVESVISDPDLPGEQISSKQTQQLFELLAQHPLASKQLKARSKDAATRLGPATVAVPTQATKTPPAPSLPPTPAATPTPLAVPVRIPPPTSRCLRGYAVDPSLRTKLDTTPISMMEFKVPWEPLSPGPVGEYLEVIDVDPSSGCSYAPVDLDNPLLLAQNGYPPAEGIPQFHQQMVYSVASLTIKHFEHALGRPALWRPGPSPNPKEPKDDSNYVQRLRIYPHALKEANAYYSPQKIALLLGYFTTSADDPGDHVPGGITFTSLSHDIIAHETTHALLDGMHRSYTKPSNPDMQAFHEAFADIVALFQHFTYPELVRHQVSRTRGDLRDQENLLAQLAGEFGRSTGKRGALRDAIGQYNPETQKWETHKPDPEEYENTTEPHARGAILVAAVFDAFLSIYERRTEDLLRLATNGTGILPQGQLHPDLVARLSDEVAKTASHVLGICIRALDYCTVTDLTFGEYLRALITADRDLVADDYMHYRVAFIEAFRRRGIYPRDLPTLSEDSLAWRGPEQDERPVSTALMMGIEQLRPFADRHIYAKNREQVYYLARDMRATLHDWLKDHLDKDPSGPKDAEYLGLRVKPGVETRFEVRAARVANRVGPDGELLRQMVIELLQTEPTPQGFEFEGGSTLIVDLRKNSIMYCIRKDVASERRRERQAVFLADRETTLRETYFGPDDEEPFAFVHRG